MSWAPNINLYLILRQTLVFPELNPVLCKLAANVLNQGRGRCTSADAGDVAQGNYTQKTFPFFKGQLPALAVFLSVGEMYSKRCFCNLGAMFTVKDMYR